MDRETFAEKNKACLHSKVTFDVLSNPRDVACEQRSLLFLLSGLQAQEKREGEGRKEGRKKRSLNLHSLLQKPFCTQPTSPGWRCCICQKVACKKAYNNNTTQVWNSPLKDSLAAHHRLLLIIFLLCWGHIFRKWHLVLDNADCD